MKIKFGYACISKVLEITTSHTITYTNYQKLDTITRQNKLIKLAEINLDALKETLIYNIRNNIHFYRMSSNIFPLINHPTIKLDILKIEKKKLVEIGKIINKNNIRVDIHLEPYYVLNSINKDIVKSTINIIKFYENMFNTMNIKSYLILHVGSGIQGKEESLKRFINNFQKLSKSQQKLIIIENDDKIFDIQDILFLSKKLSIPAVLDYHHFLCNNSSKEIEQYLEEIFKTWQGTPKIHFSSPKNKKEKRSHNDYIIIEDFITFLEKIKSINKDFDIMIEAKEKDLALFKLVGNLKYQGYKFIDETTLIL